MGVPHAIERVLIVDDDEWVLRSFRHSLERRLGLTALVATTRDSALQLARRHRPQLAIVDLRLGCESGLDVLHDLRVEVPDATLVMISGYASVEVAVRAMKAGASDVLEKPVTPQEILSRIGGVTTDLVLETPSIDRALWEHVQRVLSDCHNNKSETARRLRRPRSWLQRFLARSVPPN